MKLLRFGPAGQEKPGVLDVQGRLRDASAWVGDWAGAALAPELLASLAARSVDALPLVPGEPGQVRLGPCVGAVGKVVAIGLNYADHAAEAGMVVPSEPVVFMKATSALCGAFDALQIPPGSTHTDWEVELAVVIGRGGRFIGEAQALSHVAGYAVMNDVSERHDQLHRGGTWDKGKGFDSFAPLGPWLVTPDEVPNPQALDLWLDVDGQAMQRGNTRTMVFGVAHLISYVSRFMSLQPGDVITTGTPPGVGMGHKPPIYLRPGQTVRLGVRGLGEQCANTVQV
jgi:2-keto-4-pentenoate hydratase/2-oxohepta-3-ene-1,7-dioic acid hydratase in catechol pathway